MNLWSVEHNVEHFLTIFVITFGWVQQQSNTKPTQKWWQKWSRNVQHCVQLIRGSFGKEILHIESILYIHTSFCFFRQKKEGKTRCMVFISIKKCKNRGKSCGLYCRAVCNTRNFSEPKNLWFIFKSSFISKVGFNGTSTVYVWQRLHFSAIFPLFFWCLSFATTGLSLPDDCLMTAWWLPDDY